MDYSVLEKSTLFQGVPASILREDLETTAHHIQCYDKDETIFHMMEDASRIGIVLEGRVQAQKAFPNGSQVNVSIRCPGDLIGPAAVFSKSRRYPCDVVALEPVTIMMFRRDDLMALMQKDVRILENFTTEIASATYMLQQRLELLSYSGIAQKAAFWLLMQARQSGKDTVRIPDSISKWAMLMNVSRPSLHRELKKLESEGILVYFSPTISQRMTTGVFSNTLRWNACNDPYPCGPGKNIKKCCGRKYDMYLKLEIFIPETHLTALQSALREVDAGHIGNYDCCLSYSPVMGTWRPLAGTTPYIGVEGQISCEPELKVEVTILADRFVETMEAIKRVHPYEEPVINAIPLWGTSFSDRKLKS